MFFFQAEDGIRDLVRSRGLGDVYKRQHSVSLSKLKIIVLMVLWNQHQAMDTLILEELLSGNDARFLH